MKRHQTLKSFITAALEYSKHPNETTVSVLQALLDATSATEDLSIFNPGSIIAEKFYASLYNLTKTLDSKTPLIWSVLDVLQHACKNSTARTALTHIYKFAPLLARVLECNLTTEKRVKVLKLLQELTYGIKIQWQEAHLPDLVLTLTQWIMQSQEEEIVTLSLGVLINLCYKNQSAIYTFMRTVDNKALHKMLLKRQASNINIRVQYCKLLIILEQTKSEIPEKTILDFVMMTFQNLSSALSQRDIILLKHIVQFFEDVRQNEHSKSALTLYSNYSQDVEKILQQLDGIEEPDCVALVLEFLLSLVKLKNPSLTPFYLQYVQIAMTWVPVDRVASKALALLKTIISDSRRNKIFGSLIAALDLSVLMLVMSADENENENDENVDMNGSSVKREVKMNSKLTELMQLLQEMSKVSDLQAEITDVFSEQKMRQLLSSILEKDEMITDNDRLENVCKDRSTAFYIHALALTSDLAIQNSNWQTLYSELMRKKQIQMMIALALFTSEGEVKQKSLQLLASVGTPQESIPAIAKCMSELESLLLIQSKSGIYTAKSETNFPHEVSLSSKQKDRMDAILLKLEEFSSEHKINNVMTSTVMEFYEFKIAAMKHSEEATQASLQAADNHSTSLQHRLSQVIAESSRLREMLLYTQQKNDDLQLEKAKLHTKLQSIEGETKKIHLTQSKEMQRLKKIVNEKSATIEQLSKKIKEIEAESGRKIRELEEEKLAVEENTKELRTTNNELKRTLEKMENSVVRKRQMLETKDKEIEAANEGIAALKQENEQLMKQCKSYAQIISEKEETNQRLLNELNEFRGMRDMIYQLTAKTRDKTNETT